MVLYFFVILLLVMSKKTLSDNIFAITYLKKMEKTTSIKYSLLLYIFASVVLAAGLASCSKGKVAKSSDTVLSDFKFAEYPDAKVVQNGTYITVYLPLEVRDLNLTQEFSISSGATGSPASGEKRDFGVTRAIDVTSEDNLYMTSYYVSVIYPGSRTDFNEVELAAQSEKYGQDFSLLYAAFHSAESASGMIKWDGFAMSNRSGFDKNDIPADVSSLQFYAAEDSGLGNYVLARVGYGPENALELEFTRPVNLDTLTLAPSALLFASMKDGFVGDASIPAFDGMSSEKGDYMIINFEGVDAEGEVLVPKEVYMADFRYAENTYIRDSWQTIKFKATKLKNIVKLRIYLTASRQDFFPVFAIDKLTYQVQPAITPSEGE